jgi:hypothetical protein
MQLSERVRLTPRLLAHIELFGPAVGAPKQRATRCNFCYTNCYTEGSTRVSKPLF